MLFLRSTRPTEPSLDELREVAQIMSANGLTALTWRGLYLHRSATPLSPASAIVVTKDKPIEADPQHNLEKLLHDLF